MFGIVSSIIAGISMSIQGVFNTRLGEKIGEFQANAFVQGTGFILALILVFFTGTKNFNHIKEANKLYLTGGILGVIIVLTVMAGIKALGPACCIAIILIAQLSSAALIDAFGLFESTQIKFGANKIAGMIIMIIGIIIFKWKC